MANIVGGGRGVMSQLKPYQYLYFSPQRPSAKQVAQGINEDHLSTPGRVERARENLAIKRMEAGDNADQWFDLEGA